MSLFYQITGSTTNNLKPTSWKLNNKLTTFNTKAKIKIWSISFSGDRMLRGSIFSSTPNSIVELNDIVDINPIANLLINNNVIKANNISNFNNQDTTFIK